MSWRAGLSSADVAELNFCPIVPVDMEHLFNVFKHIFSDCHQSFTEENLEKIVVVNCFHFRKQ